MRTGRSNNKGYSIIEMVIVITILVILSAGTVLGLGVIKNARDKKLAQSVYSAIGRTRVNTMAKGDNYDAGPGTCAVLKMESDGYYLIMYSDGNEESNDKIGIKNQVVTYKKDGSSPAVMNSGDQLEVHFKHDSGIPNKDKCDFTELIVGKNTVVLELATGKCELKRD